MASLKDVLGRQKSVSENFVCEIFYFPYLYTISPECDIFSVSRLAKKNTIILFRITREKGNSFDPKIGCA